MIHEASASTIEQVLTCYDLRNRLGTLFNLLNNFYYDLHK